MLTYIYIYTYIYIHTHAVLPISTILNSGLVLPGRLSLGSGDRPAPDALRDAAVLDPGQSRAFVQIH